MKINICIIMGRWWYAALGAREQAECIEMMLTLTIFISITKMINVIVTLPLYNPNLIHCETFHLHRFVISLFETLCCSARF